MCQCDTDEESSTFNVSNWNWRKSSTSQMPGIDFTSCLAKEAAG